VKILSFFGRLVVAFLICASLLYFPLLAGQVASQFDYPFDPDGAFAWISVHHLVQAGMFVIFIFVIDILSPRNYGLRIGDWKRGFKYIKNFTLFFLVYTALGFAYVLSSDMFQPFAYPLTTTNILGQLGFQLFLSGPSEEWLFRAFGLGLLVLLFPKRILGGRLSVANLTIAVVFALAHVSIFVDPFRIAYNPVQLIYAFALGLIYGDCYEKTGSVLYPMAIHSISNVIAVATTIAVTALLG
jgi:uncharacterized protein